MKVARVAFAIAAIALLLLAVGCGRATSGRQTPSGIHGSWEATRTFDNAEQVPPAPVPPPPPMLDRDPRTSVYSYLLWISYAYRILSSDVATSTFTPWEEVRVNSYVALNKLEKKRALDQVIVKLEFKGEPRITDDTSTVTGIDLEQAKPPYSKVAIVPAVETWKYRYIDIKTGRYAGPWYDVTYDSTYTVVFDESRKAWLVHQVDATPRGEVK